MSLSLPRVVIDTGVLISRLLRPHSPPAEAVALALSRTTILISEETLAELITVLARPKSAVYVDAQDAIDAAQSLAGIAEIVSVTTTLSACRDPDDNKFLALALTGGAQFIITGDDDLLTLHPFQDVDILSPRQFLDKFEEVANSMSSGSWST